MATRVRRKANAVQQLVELGMARRVRSDEVVDEAHAEYHVSELIDRHDEEDHSSVAFVDAPRCGSTSAAEVDQSRPTHFLCHLVTRRPSC